jgi:hypothetical protein
VIAQSVTNEVINVEPIMWRYYFGQHEQIVRADLSIVFAHPISDVTVQVGKTG